MSAAVTDAFDENVDTGPVSVAADELPADIGTTTESANDTTDYPTQIIPRIGAAAPPAPPVVPAPYPQPPAPAYRIDHLPSGPRVRRKPASGWRRGVYWLTAGLVNLGDSRRDQLRRHLIRRAGVPIQGDYRIAVLSLKGGVGKTTTTAALGATLAAARGDRVIAVDANPDFGTLAQRGPDTTASTVRNVLADPAITRYADMQVHTSQTESRLEILASERDAAASEAFSALDYKRLIEILHRYYNIILTDCGTGLVHSAMRGVLGEANAVVLVTSPALDSIRSTAATLDWLAFHGYQRLAATATVVISGARPGVDTRDITALLGYFGQRARSVHFVPFDEHLAEGAQILLHRMNRDSRDAFLGLAAALAEDFPAAGPW